MGVPTGGVGFLKFITIGLYVFVLFGLLVGIIKAGMYWSDTGDFKPLVESTLGQILAWDTEIYLGIESLKDDKMINTLPEVFRDDYRNFIVKQILFYLLLFAIVAFGLFKLGNWFLGIHSFSWQTDVIILAVILLVIFPFAEFGYGMLMDKENIIPYRGVAQLVKPATWKLLLGSYETSSSYDSYLKDNNLGNYTNIDLGGGS